MSDEELARIDPVELNLQVAKGIPALADLDICRYQRLADEFYTGVQFLVTKAQGHFWRNPSDWKKDTTSSTSVYCASVSSANSAWTIARTSATSRASGTPTRRTCS